MRPNIFVEYVITINTTTLNKRVSFRVSDVEYIAETDEGTTIHLDSGRHLTTELNYDRVYLLIWPDVSKGKK